MKYSLAVVSGLVLSTIGYTTLSAQTPATEPATIQPMARNAEPLLGKLFRSRIAGISLNPPAGGGKIQELNAAELVRFVYPDSSWDIRVKTIPLHVPLSLSAPPDAGVLELAAAHLTDTNPTAEILKSDVVQIHGKDVGMIEARYNAGTDRVFAQQAIFKDFENSRQFYYSIQMTSKGKPKSAPANLTDPDEAEARTAFNSMLDTVQVLDRNDLIMEQNRRQWSTRLLWVNVNRKTIMAAMEPLHFMRVVRDGRDVGYLQINERQATHNGRDGIELIVYSRVEADQQRSERADAPAVGVDSTSAAADASTNGGIVISKPIGPVIAQTTATAPSSPEIIFTSSTYFATFDREHEDWNTITQIDDHKAIQTTESAYSDMTFKLRPDPAGKPQVNRNPAMLQEPNYLLNVAYSIGQHQDKPTDIGLPPIYLPQLLSQMLPRLLPTDPGQYIFAFYVSNQRHLMSRYVDVESARDVNLDGQVVHAVPITDRIGADGIGTTHYVTRQNVWLGSISEDSRLQVFPSDAHTLKGLWNHQFEVRPEPAPDGDAAPAAPVPDDKPGDVQSLKPNSR